MTPEAAEHLEKAREYLVKARGLLDVMHYNDEAGRAAYLAGFHAAQALISERTARVPKTHEGVSSQFNLLVRDVATIDAELRNFLGRAHNLKAVADYETGPGSIVPPGAGRGGVGNRGPVCQCRRRAACIAASAKRRLPDAGRRSSARACGPRRRGFTGRSNPLASPAAPCTRRR